MKTFQIKQFEWAGKRYILKWPITATVTQAIDLWVYKVPHYKLHVYSFDEEEAKKMLHEDFAITYEELCLEKDEKLSDDAIELKNRILRNLERIEEIKMNETTGIGQGNQDEPTTSQPPIYPPYKSSVTNPDFGQEVITISESEGDKI